MFKSLLVPTDEQLMWRVKLQEDHHAFATLMERWQQPIRNLCARMTGDAHEAEDLCQNAFARIFARRAQWQPTAKFSTYLWRVAVNLCHDRQRQRRPEWLADFAIHGDDANHAWEDLALEEAGPDAQAETHERADLVQQALNRLRPNHREVVVLRHFEGLKFHEIAEVLGVPEGTIKSRMVEALNRLQQLLKNLNETTATRPAVNKKDLLAL